MKTTFLAGIFCFGAFCTSGQSLEDVGELLKKNQYPAAKTAIDKIAADPKNQKDGQTWFYKATVYNNYANDASISSAMAYDLRSQAFDAYKKYQEVDKTELYLKSDFYRPYLYIYSGFFNLGAQQFNAKDYEGAYKSFQKADEARNLIRAKNYTYDDLKFYALDTNLVMNMVAASINLKNTDEAAAGYKKLVDAGVAGKDYEDAYRYLVDYYSTKKDETNFRKYIALGRLRYPQSSFWSAYELDQLAQGTDKKALFDKYQEAIAQNPADYNLTYNYAAELYNSIYKDMNYPDSAAGKERLTEALKAAIANDKEIEATIVMSNHLYNYSAEYSAQANAVKGKTPADLALKKELNAKADAKAEELIPYANAVVKYYTDNPPSKVKQKTELRTAYGYLADVYAIKKDTKKSEEYEKLKDGVKF